MHYRLPDAVSVPETQSHTLGVHVRPETHSHTLVWYGCGQPWLPRALSLGIQPNKSLLPACQSQNWQCDGMETRVKQELERLTYPWPQKHFRGLTAQFSSLNPFPRRTVKLQPWPHAGLSSNCISNVQLSPFPRHCTSLGRAHLEGVSPAQSHQASRWAALVGQGEP